MRIGCQMAIYKHTVTCSSIIGIGIFVLMMLLLRDAGRLEFRLFLGIPWLGAALLHHGSGA